MKRYLLTEHSPSLSSAQAPNQLESLSAASDRSPPSRACRHLPAAGLLQPRLHSSPILYSLSSRLSYAGTSSSGGFALIRLLQPSSLQFISFSPTARTLPYRPVAAVDSYSNNPRGRNSDTAVYTEENNPYIETSPRRPPQLRNRESSVSHKQCVCYSS